MSQYAINEIKTDNKIAIQTIILTNCFFFSSYSISFFSLTLTNSGVIVWVKTIGINNIKSKNFPAVAKYPTDSLSTILPIITWSIL